jgi:hypothetical protein
MISRNATARIVVPSGLVSVVIQVDGLAVSMPESRLSR